MHDLQTRLPNCVLRPTNNGVLAAIADWNDEREGFIKVEQKELTYRRS